MAYPWLVLRLECLICVSTDSLCSGTPWAGGIIISAMIPNPAVGRSLWELLSCPGWGLEGTACASVPAGD